MIPVLYPSTETSFTTNGLGGLPDAISCVVTEQRNTQGGYYLEMDYPIDGLHYADIAPERIIYAAPFMGATPQPFRISRINRPINGIVHIEAPHVSAELQKIVTYGRMRAYTVWGLWSDFKGVATNIGQACPFTISSNFNLTEAINFWFDEPITMASLLMGMEGSMLDKIGGEIEFDKWNVVYNTQRGVNSGLEIRYGVNMSDLEAETDATELVTACVPYWKGTVNEVDTVVVGDMCSATNASTYAYVRCVPLDVSQQFEETDTQPTKAQVTEKGQAFINSTSRRLLQTSIRVSYEPTTSGIGERRINLCDTVRVVYPDLNVSSISKVVETKFNTLTERYDELTIGTIRNNIVDTIAGLVGGSSYSGGGSSGGGGGSSPVTSVNGMMGDVVLNAASVGALPSTYTAPVTSVNGMTGDVVVSGGGGAVDSVNGKTGVVVLNASDVSALPANTPIPAEVTEQTVSGWGFTKNTGDYTKPAGGIPKTDLAADVQTSLGKADTALQTAPVVSVNNKTGAVVLKTSDLQNDSGYITSVPVTSVNGKTGAVVLDAEDVGALPDDTFIPSKTSELVNDAHFVTEAEAGVSSVNGQTGVVLLTTSDIANTSGYITANDIPQEVPTADASANGMVLGVDNGRYTFVRMTGGISDVYMDGASIVQSGTTIAAIPNANTTRFGVVKLYDGSDSTSTSLVPTANALRGVGQRVGNLETRSANWLTETQIKELIDSMVHEQIAMYQRRVFALEDNKEDIDISSLSDLTSHDILYGEHWKQIGTSNNYGAVLYNPESKTIGGSSSDLIYLKRGYIIAVSKNSWFVTSDQNWYCSHVFLSYPKMQAVYAYDEENNIRYIAADIPAEIVEQAKVLAEDFLSQIESLETEI